MKRVLLVDDDLGFLQDMSRALLARGYCVEEASDGLEALHKALQEPPDVAVVDLVMPRVGGVELVSFFRQNAYLSSVPIIVLSGVLAEGGPLLDSLAGHRIVPKGPVEETARVLLASLDALEAGSAAPAELGGRLRQRRQVVELLRVNRDLGLVLEGAGVAILDLDLQGCIAYANSRAEELLGIGRAALVGTELLSLVPPAGRRQLETLLARVYREPAPASRVMTLEIGERMVRTVLTSIWADGALQAIVATLYEVASESDAESRPLRLLRYLAHEMRSSLLMMEGHLRALAKQESPDSNRQRGHPELPVTPAFLAGEAGRLLRLIGDASTLHQTFRELRSIDMEPLDLVNVVKDSISGITALAVPRGIEVTFSGPSTAPRILGNRDRLLQALYNLLLNALKFTPRTGSVWVDLKATGNALAVTVGDTGQGIPPKTLRELLIQAHHPEVFLPRKEQRVGLGLSIALQIVRAHGGQLTAQSEVGRGSRFTLTLPIWWDGADASGGSASAGDRV